MRRCIARMECRKWIALLNCRGGVEKSDNQIRVMGLSGMTEKNHMGSSPQTDVGWGQVKVNNLDGGGCSVLAVGSRRDGPRTLVEREISKGFGTGLDRELTGLSGALVPGRHAP